MALPVISVQLGTLVADLVDGLSNGARIIRLSALDEQWIQDD
jgi:hypothetical protein